MEINEIKRIPIVSVLNANNINPVKINDREAWYYAFHRSERTPSVKVDLERNIFYDFGSGEGGSVIDLAISLNSSRGVGEAIRYLSQYVGNYNCDLKLAPLNPVENERLNQLIVFNEEPLSHPALLSYIKERNVCYNIVKKYCSEVYFEIRSKKYFGIGFKNDSSGY